MAHINLLPWREELYKEHQRQFIVVAAGSVILMGLILLLVHINVEHSIDSQQARNHFLQNQIAKVEKQIHTIRDLEKKKQRLLNRMDIIQRLQRNRPEVVHLFDQIARRTPNGVYLTSLRESGNTMIFKGMAESNARVSAFMRNLNASKWFTNPQLDVIHSKAKGGVRRSDFTLHVAIVFKGSKTQGQNKRRKP